MRTIKLLIIGVLFITLSGQVYSQSRLVERGNKLFERYAFDQAIELYLKAVKKEEKSTVLYANLADSYYLNSDMDQAVLWYETLMSHASDDVIGGEYYFRYAQALKAIGEYSKSDQWLDKLNSINQDDSRGVSLKFDPNYLERIEAQANRFEIHPASVNTKYSDFAAAYSSEGVIFSSSRDGGVSRKLLHKWTGLPFLQLYTGDVDESGDITNAELLEGDFDSKYNESTVAITHDGNTMYFTRNSYDNGYQEDQSGIVRLKLYQATKQNDKWVDIKELPFNSTEYSVAHPALSPDNKQLYFASDMEGTLGFSDIYVVDILADGGFGAPRNLGPQINTEGRDTFPFVSKNGDLYFSTDGHLGLGGLDIFVCIDPSDPNKDNIFNAGRPVNSKRDDFAFVIDDDTSLGYFTSNRAGGQGNDDIYRLKQIAPVNKTCDTRVVGTVIDKTTGEILPNTKVIIYNVKSQIVQDIVSDDQGAFAFDLNCGEDEFTAIGNKDLYRPGTDSFRVDGSEAEVRLELALEPEPTLPEVGQELTEYLNLNPIYFDLDKSFIRPDARVELEKVYGFMSQNPSVKIDVRSHTDSRARDGYNLSLSQRRNASTIQYLIDRGIDSSRLTGRGYGETQLVNHCSNGVKCSDQEHEQNRRSEFIVMSK